MSNAVAIISGDIYDTKDAFNAVLVDRSLSFEREAEFAIQVLCGNKYAMDIATSNRQSVTNAVTNVAAIGLSLNPARKLAYLVPRDGKICLDISYMGLIEIAIASGSVLWAQAKVVHANESFKLNGYDKPPEHAHDPFSRNKGDPVGVYVVAKMHSGDYLTEPMSVDEINAIRDRSSAWKAYVEKKKSCPWVTDWAEMAKKTVIKRASKMWPKTERLDKATHFLNTEGNEGLAELAGNKPSEGFDCEHWISEARAAKTEPDLVKVYAEAMGVAAKFEDRAGATRFKNEAMRLREEIRKRAADNTIDMEGGEK